MATFFAYMDKDDIFYACLSWFLAGLGVLWVLFYGLANSGAGDGNHVPQSIPYHLFILPVSAILVAVSVIYSTHKRGSSGKGLLATILPLAVSLFAIFISLIICGNSGVK